MAVDDGVIRRKADPGEICSCGRPAASVLEIAGRLPCGWCGTGDVAPLEPCTEADCPCSTGPHDRRWCTPERRAELVAMAAERAARR